MDFEHSEAWQAGVAARDLGGGQRPGVEVGPVRVELHQPTRPGGSPFLHREHELEDAVLIKRLRAKRPDGVDLIHDRWHLIRADGGIRQHDVVIGKSAFRSPVEEASCDFAEDALEASRIGIEER